MAEPTSPLRFNADDIVDSLREPILVLSGDLRVERANRAFYEVFRISPESTEGCFLYDLGNGQWNIPALRTLLEVILPDRTEFNGFEVEHDFPNIGCKSMLLNARRLRHASNHSELILLAIEDVTERRRLEDQRRELETRFTSLVKNIRDHSIFTLDPAGRITSWNDEAQRILGFSEQEALGQHYSIIFSPEDQRAGIPAQEMQVALAEGRAEDERWHVRKGGERFWAFGIVTPTHDATGKHTGYSKILRDMTDRKRAEEALREADCRKDEFMALLAHELRNPLAAILYAANLLPDDDTASESVQSAAEVIERQVDQLVRLIEDLLDLSRIGQGKIQLRVRRFDLASAIHRAVESARPHCEGMGQTISVNLPPQPLFVHADPARLAQIVSNLLNNACKFTDRGGHVWLSVESQEGELVIRVRDDGIGIPPDQLTRVFEKFTQLDSSQERTRGGLGIGLSLVKNVAQLHGGSVEAHSAGLGQGSEFVVRLPILAVPEEVPPESAGPQSSPATVARRILVVDDNRDSAWFLAELLRRAGHEISMAYDGEEALQVAEEFRPDTVLLDIGMPKRNGYDVARDLRQRPWGAELNLVAVTGWGQPEDRQRSSEAGFNAHLVKPVKLAALSKLFEELPLPNSQA